MGESESFGWNSLGRLKARALWDVDLVVLDEHKGLVNAVKIHYIRDLLETERHNRKSSTAACGHGHRAALEG
ncbi:MAG: transposase [Thermodesulfobacteriota bacterium]